jgi:hypothetical protein
MLIEKNEILESHFEIFGWKKRLSLGQTNAIGNMCGLRPY